MNGKPPQVLLRSGTYRPRRPLVDDVRDHIARDLILSDVVKPGERLPSEKDLSERYAVSRITVRACLQSLQQAGLVNIRHGVGTVVLPRPRAVTHGLDRLCSLETFAREAGQTLRTEELDVEESPADAEMARRFDIAEGDTVIVVRRLKMFADERVAWTIDYVPAASIPAATLQGEFAGSVLDVLLTHQELAVEYADTEIEPVNLPLDIAERLRVEPGRAALLVDSLAWTADGRAIDWALSWLLPEHFRFLVRRRRQIG